MRAIFFFALTTFGAMAQAQVGGPGLGMMNGRAGTTAEYGYQISGASNNNGSIPTPQIDQHLLRGNFVVYREGSDSLSVNAGATSFELHEAVPIENARVNEATVPTKLMDLGVGLGFSRELDSGRNLGGMFSVGSASDKPFSMLKDTTFSLTGTYTKPIDENHSWIFALNWSNNRSFLNYIPFPIAAYQMKEPTSGLFALIGVPFLLSLNPPGSKASYKLFILPSALTTEVAYRVWGPMQAYAKAEWGQEVWMRANRAVEKDRIIFDQKRVAIGIRTPTPGGFMVDLAGGFSFDRKFLQAESVYKTGAERAELEPTWLVTLRVNYMPDLFAAMKAKSSR